MNGLNLEKRDVANDAAPVLALEGIEKSYGAVRALRGVDLQLKPGEIHAIVGENGAGKSTLIGVAAGVVQANAGRILVNGAAVSEPDPLAMRDAGISVVFQHPALARDLTVLENLRLGVKSDRPVPTKASAQALIDRVSSDALRVGVDTRVSDLNLAQMHVVEIARALVSEPSVVVFDEPTEPFQQADVQRLFDVIRRLKVENVAIAYISHRLHEVMEIADCVTVLRDGEMVGHDRAGDLDIDKVITLIAGRPLDQIFPAKGRSPGSAVLSVAELTGKGFAGINIAVRSGEILGLAGVEGQGQRDFLRALAGLSRHEGSVVVDGRQRRITSPSAAQEAGMAFLSDDRHGEGLFLGLDIQENIGLRILERISSWGVVSSVSEARSAKDATSRLAVKAPSLGTRIANLSGGNQQKVLFARETYAGARVYLIDEPTKGVDIGSRSEIYQQIRALANEGAAVIVLSSDGVELEGLCDRVLVFARGQVVAELTGEAVNDDRITGASLTATVLRRDAQGGPARTRHSFFRSDYFPILVLCAMIALVVGMTAAGNPYFLDASNVTNLLVLVSVLAMVSCAQLGPILTGGIDLSVGPMAGFSLILASFFLGPDIPASSLIGYSLMILAIGGAVGVAQGALIAFAGLPAIVVTLASFIGLQGVSLILRPQPTGDITETLGELASASLFGLPVAFAFAVSIVLLLEIVLFRTSAGRKIRAVGSDPDAAFRLGTSRIKSQLSAYGASGVLAALAGLILAGQIGLGSASVGTDYTLLSVTVVVLSGASITGGRGSFLCVLFSALLVQSTTSASSFVQIDPAWQYVVVGVIAIVAASLFGLSRAGGAQNSSSHA